MEWWSVDLVLVFIAERFLMVAVDFESTEENTRMPLASRSDA